MSNKFDERGIEYLDDAKTVLIRCPDSLSGEVEILQSVKVIQGGDKDVNSPFYKCRANITSLRFATFSKCESICKFCFYSSNLETADLRQCDKLQYLNYSVFSSCPKLSTFFFPPKIISIKSGCFYKCYSLNTINLPDSVETIEGWAGDHNWAFGYTSSISFNISPNSNLTTLSNECFALVKCKSIFIPKKVNQIGQGVFVASSIETINIDSENTVYRSNGKSVYTGDNNQTLVFVVPSYSGEYIVPNFVTLIYNGCFRGTKINNFTLHENISSIGNWAFSGTPIKSIKMPENVTVINRFTFQDCHSLQYINLSSKTGSIKASAFNNCENLLFMEIPETLTNIGQSAFTGCIKLTIDASKNKNIDYRDQMLFTDNKKTLSTYFGSETKDLVIPEGLTSIGISVFSSKNLRYVTFNGNTLESINERAFESSTIEKIDIPSSVTYIGPKCFYGCNNLSTVNFISNNALTVIPNNCFYNCQKLSNIKLPPSIQTIGENAFWSCFSLGDIGMSSTQISKINEFAFQNSGLTTFVNTKNSVTIKFGSFMNCGIETVSFITESVPENCFYNCQKLISVNLNNNPSSIEASAFEFCTKLESFEIPSSLTVMKSFAFRNCYSLSRVSLPFHSNINEIYGGAFVNCPNLISIQVDESDDRYRFSNGAFTNYDETRLIAFIPSNPTDTYIVPVTMTTIGNYAFMSCSNLVRILFSGNSIKELGTESLKGCSKLSFLYITSSSLTTIGERAFEDSPHLLKCGSIRCSKSKINLFTQRNIPIISFELDCKLIVNTCAQKLSTFSPIFITLLTPIIIM